MPDDNIKTSGNTPVGTGQRGPGRPPGTPNKITTLLKDAVMLAAQEVGEDQKGEGGLVGYCRFLAKEEPRAFSTLLGKILPNQIEGTGEAGEIVFQTIYEAKK